MAVSFGLLVRRHLLKRQESPRCHGEAFFAEACFLGSQSPSVTSGDYLVAQSAPRHDNPNPVMARRFLPKQSPGITIGDCFVAKGAPRNDRTGCNCGQT